MLFASKCFYSITQYLFNAYQMTDHKICAEVEPSLFALFDNTSLSASVTQGLLKIFAAAPPARTHTFVRFNHYAL